MPFQLPLASLHDEITQITATKDSVWNSLIGKQVLCQTVTCSSCSSQMVFIQCAASKSADGDIWKCQTCKKFTNIRADCSTDSWSSCIICRSSSSTLCRFAIIFIVRSWHGPLVPDTEAALGKQKRKNTADLKKSGKLLPWSATNSVFLYSLFSYCVGYYITFFFISLNLIVFFNCLPTVSQTEVGVPPHCQNFLIKQVYILLRDTADPLGCRGLLWGIINHLTVFLQQQKNNFMYLFIHWIVLYLLLLSITAVNIEILFYFYYLNNTKPETKESKRTWIWHVPVCILQTANVPCRRASRFTIILLFACITYKQ